MFQVLLRLAHIRRPYRLLLVVVGHLALFVLSYVASFVLRLDFNVGEIPADLLLKSLPILVLVRTGGMALFGLHKGLWRYVGVVDLLQIMKATTVTSLAFSLLMLVIFGFSGFPLSVIIMDWAGNVFLLGGVRLSIRVIRERIVQPSSVRGRLKRMLIVGAGDAGAALCRQAMNNPAFRFRPVAFVDDNPNKVGTSILTVPVVGTCDELPSVVKEYQIDAVVIAIPSATGAEMRRLVDTCHKAGISPQILPATPDILEGRVTISRIREVDPIDLLGRAPARLDRAVLGEFVRGKRIVITGGAGSVGSELVRQIAEFNPAFVVVIDRAENPLYFADAEFRATFPDLCIVSRVLDVTDGVEMKSVMTKYEPQVLFHAAAHKHVPLMEDSPREAIKNNVVGTYVLAKAAIDVGVENFTLVSTDKAVNPSSVMGAAKRVAELLIQELNALGPTRFVAVRFGNVLGSNASVVPIFKTQIARGGPVTVTHPEAKRFFMSLSEAAGLILEATAIGEGGEIFSLDMGDQIRIVTLAETLITLSGLQPYEDINIVFTGLRPGEKLSEELSLEGEDVQPTGYEKLMVLKGDYEANEITSKVEGLVESLSNQESEQSLLWLQQLVPEYRPVTATRDMV